MGKLFPFRLRGPVAADLHFARFAHSVETSPPRHPFAGWVHRATFSASLLKTVRVGILIAMMNRIYSVCLLLVGVLTAAPASAQGLDLQLQEIRTLILEKRYPLALESLRLVARQIQDLRLETVAPAFPATLDGWTALPALSLLEEDEIWNNRITAQRAYVAVPGPARLEITIDLHSPFGPAVALKFNPIVLTGDPLSRLVPIGDETALLRFNPDTGEGELRVLAGRDTLVTARGRGILSPEILIDFARRIDYHLLHQLSGL